MPYIIRPPKGARKLAATVFGTAILICAAPAVASAACPSTPTSAALAQFGDNAAYSLLSGSTFESGAQGWSLTNAEVLSGEGANGDANALAIEPDGVAVSPAFCVSPEDMSFRFFARQSGGGDGPVAALKVSLRWTVGYGFHKEADVASLQAGSSWTLSPALQLASLLPLWTWDRTLNVKLVFQPTGGSFEIDDVYIDPYSR